MARTINKWLVVTLVLILGFGQLLRFDVGRIPLYAHDIVVIFILLANVPAIHTAGLQILRSLLAFMYSKGGGGNIKSGQSIPAYYSLIVLGMSGGWAAALAVAPSGPLIPPLLYSLRFLAYLLLFGVFKETKVKLHARYLYLAMATTAVIGLAQFLFLPDMRIFAYAGWDDHLNRLILPHYDPTFTGVMLGMFMLYIGGTERRLAGLLFIPLIIATYARSVWISLVSTVLLRTSHKRSVLLAVAILCTAIIVLPRRFGEGTNIFRTYSITSRINYDISLAKTLGWKNISGVGMNTLPYFMGVSTAQAGNTPVHATGPNNSYLYMLMTSGVIGLTGLLLFLRTLYRESSHQPLLLFVMIASLFNNVLFYPFVLLWILIIESVRVPSGS